MTPAETAALLSFAAAFDRRTLGEADVLAWHTVLADIAFEPAKAAVTAHYATETRWIMPADIRQHVLARRNDTAADIQGPGLPAAIPDADPDDIPAYLAAVREQRTRAANGQLRPRPVRELLAGVGRQAPTKTTQTGPLSVECPYCGAGPLHRCRRGDTGLLVGFHPSRIDAAKSTA
ncbi:zinc finger domain-containing protein [Streptomyces fumanus]|uniref:zinc finger domain-containing protein n=1 Tax=Streptomyces fumanus TaxID=67302 RepID=UPI0033FF2DA7